jgi:hypothetical protein
MAFPFIISTAPAILIFVLQKIDMFHSISWQQYTYTILFLLAAYYAVIGWVFFRHKINTAWVNYPASRGAAANKYAPAMDLLHSVQLAMGALGLLLETAAGRQYSATELLTGIKNILSNYPLIKGSLFEATINQWLIARAAAACRIEFTAMELQRCW